MTIEKLENYYFIAKNIEAIELDISKLSKPISSPNGNTTGIHSSTPGDPTAKAAMQIIALKELLASERERQIMLKLEIENFLNGIGDAEIAAIIRWHYVHLKSWKVTNLKVYGYPDYRYARRKVERYFKKLSEE